MSETVRVNVYPNMAPPNAKLTKLTKIVDQLSKASVERLRRILTAINDTTANSKERKEVKHEKA